MVYLYYKHQKDRPKFSRRLDPLPRVTVQLPLYNEMYVVRRLIAASCNIDYPKELIDIQVLDDSTDETTVIAQECVKEFKDKGFDINYVPAKTGKASRAALLRRLKTAKLSLSQSLTYFLPSKDIIHKAIHHFSDKSVGMVQTRWVT
jgi:cellulose synthase/poly-beta-1,6-N-acetylglucosamine synthase-like glycosyltransferase